MLARRLLNLADWSPLNMFTSGTKGFLYDPQNLGAIFQDTASTTAVSASGNSVGILRDLSGNEMHATRYTDDTHRGTWTATTDGHPYLTMNGTTAGYSVPTGLTANVVALTCCAAIQVTNFNSAGIIFSSQTPTGGNDRWTFYVDTTAALSFFGRRLDADAGTGLAGPTLTSLTNFVVFGEMDYSNARAEMRLNRTIFRSTYLTAGATSNTSSFGNGFGVFLDAGPDSWLIGRIYGAFLLTNRTLTEGEKQLLMNWMGRKVGLVI